MSSRRGGNFPSHFMLKKPEMTACIMGHLAPISYAAFNLYLNISKHFFKVKQKVNFRRYKMQTEDNQSKFLGHGF